MRRGRVGPQKNNKKNKKKKGGEPQPSERVPRLAPLIASGLTHVLSTLPPSPITALAEYYEGLASSSPLPRGAHTPQTHPSMGDVLASTYAAGSGEGMTGHGLVALMEEVGVGGRGEEGVLDVVRERGDELMSFGEVVAGVQAMVLIRQMRQVAERLFDQADVGERGAVSSRMVASMAAEVGAPYGGGGSGVGGGREVGKDAFVDAMIAID